MGQTYIVVNVNDKTYFFVSSLDADTGDKFLEAWQSVSYAQAMAVLTSVGQGLGGGDLLAVDKQLVGSWVGKRIATLGQYAEYMDITMDLVTQSGSAWTNIAGQLSTLIRVQEELDEERVRLNKMLGDALGQGGVKDILGTRLTPAQAKRTFVLTQDDLDRYTFVVEDPLTKRPEVLAVYAAGAALRRWHAVGIIDRERQFRALTKEQRQRVVAEFKRQRADQISRVQKAREILALVKPLSDQNKVVALGKREMAVIATIREQLNRALLRADLFNVVVPLQKFAQLESSITVVSRTDDDDTGREQLLSERQDFRANIEKLLADARNEVRRAVLDRRPTLQAFSKNIREILAELARMFTLVERFERDEIELVNARSYRQFRDRLAEASRVLDVRTVEKMVDEGKLPGPAVVRVLDDAGDSADEKARRQSRASGIRKEIDLIVNGEIRLLFGEFEKLFDAIDRERDADKLEVPPASDGNEQAQREEMQVDDDDDDDNNEKRAAEPKDDESTKRQRVECQVCGADAAWQCQGCDEAYYCSQKHAVEHWKSGHANACQK